MRVRKKGMRWRCLLLCLSLLIAGCVHPTAWAAETSVEGGCEPAFDGYLVKLRGTAAAEGLVTLTAEGTDGAWVVVDTLEQAARLPAEQVAYIEPNYTVTLYDSAEYTPNDPYYADEQWYLQSIHAMAAYEAGLRGEGVTVAFVDSGINGAHEDLDAAHVSGVDFCADGLTYAQDSTGHGTLAAGVVAAQTDNELGVAGLAPDVQIMAYRAFNAKTASLSTVIAAIERAAADGCDIMNLSFGMSATSQALKEVIAAVAAQGIIIVAAVGNGGSTELQYPAAYAQVIGVGSVGAEMTVSSFSQKNSSVFVTAPGEDIAGLGHTAADSYRLSGVNGTSFAAPIVTGMAAVAKGYAAAITADSVRQLLAESATDRGTAGYDTSYGHGVVDVAAFIARLQAEFTLQYVTNGGTELPAGSYRVTDEEMTLPVPTREGYLFTGWYETENLSGAAVAAIPAGSVGDRTFYAGWAVNSAVAVQSVRVCLAPEEEGAPFFDGVWHEGTGQDDGYYQVILPYGTDPEALSAENFVVVALTEDSTVSEPQMVEENPLVWQFTVTSVDEQESRIYTVKLEVMQLRVVTPAIGGTAQPASFDATVAAVPYTVDFGTLAACFQFGDGEPLPADITYEVTVADGSGELTPAETGYCYTPSAQDTGRAVILHIYAVSDGRRTLDCVTATVAVGAIPPSQAYLINERLTGTVQFDRYTETRLQVGLLLYGNAVADVSLGGAALTLGADYTVEEVSLQVDYYTGISYLVLNESACAALEVGQAELVIAFLSGEPCTVTITVTDSAPRWSVIFRSEGELYHTAADIRDGDTVAFPSDPTRSGHTFGGWFDEENGAGRRYTEADPITENLTLYAKWTEDAPAGPGPGDHGNPGPSNPGPGNPGPGDPGPGDPDPGDSGDPGDSSTGGGGGIGGGGGGGMMPPIVNPFHDVKETDWFCDDVAWAYASGLFNGVSEDTFDPQGTMTRAMLVTVLFRMDAATAGADGAEFTDVAPGQWYSDAVAWGAAAGLVSGDGSGRFLPDAPVTREQLAVILYRYMRHRGIAKIVTQDYIVFTDAEQIAPYADEAIQMLYKLAILRGTGEQTINPKASASRAEVAAMLHRFQAL